MSYYRQKPRYVEKGTNYVEKGKEPQQQSRNKQGQTYKRKDHNGYRQKDNGGYDYDISTITLETVIPKPPKKEELLTMPRIEEWEQKEEVLVEQIRDLKDKRKEVNNSKFVREKQVKEQNGQTNVFNQYDVQREEMLKLRDRKLALFKEVNPRKQEIQHLTEELEKLNQQLKSYEGGGKRSKQALEQRLESLMDQRVRGALNPKQEKAINQEIENVKKDLSSAVSYESIEVRRVIINEKKNELWKQRDALYKEKKPFSEELDIVLKQFNEKNQKVKSLISKFDEVKEAKKTYKEGIQKERDDFHNSKFEKKKEINNQIDNINDKIDAIWDEYDQKVKDYRKQQQYLDYISWMTKQKQFLLARKKKEQDRKIWEEKEKARKERQIEWEKNKPKKYTPHIKNCEFLIQYCERLRPQKQETQPEKQQEKPSAEEIQKLLNDDKQWKKEKGVTLIQSKKSKDEDVDTKPKKQTRQEIEDKQKQSEIINYNHDFNVAAIFEDVKTLPPQNQKELDKVIGELNERISYYNKMNEEEKDLPVETKQQYRARQDPDEPRQQKPERNQRKSKQQRFQPKAEDFPSL